MTAFAFILGAALVVAEPPFGVAAADELARELAAPNPRPHDIARALEVLGVKPRPEFEAQDTSANKRAWLLDPSNGILRVRVGDVPTTPQSQVLCLPAGPIRPSQVRWCLGLASNRARHKSSLERCAAKVRETFGDWMVDTNVLARLEGTESVTPPIPRKGRPRHLDEWLSLRTEALEALAREAEQVLRNLASDQARRHEELRERESALKGARTASATVVKQAQEAWAEWRESADDALDRAITELSTATVQLDQRRPLCESVRVSVAELVVHLVDARDALSSAPAAPPSAVLFVKESMDRADGALQLAVLSSTTASCAMALPNLDPALRSQIAILYDAMAAEDRKVADAAATVRKAASTAAEAREAKVRADRAYEKGYVEQVILAAVARAIDRLANPTPKKEVAIDIDGCLSAFDEGRPYAIADGDAQDDAGSDVRGRLHAELRHACAALHEGEPSDALAWLMADGRPAPAVGTSDGELLALHEQHARARALALESARQLSAAIDVGERVWLPLAERSRDTARIGRALLWLHRAWLTSPSRERGLEEASRLEARAPRPLRDRLRLDRSLVAASLALDRGELSQATRLIAGSRRLLPVLGASPNENAALKARLLAIGARMASYPGAPPDRRDLISLLTRSGDVVALAEAVRLGGTIDPQRGLKAVRLSRARGQWTLHLERLRRSGDAASEILPRQWRDLVDSGWAVVVFSAGTDGQLWSYVFQKPNVLAATPLGERDGLMQQGAELRSLLAVPGRARQADLRRMNAALIEPWISTVATSSIALFVDGVLDGIPVHALTNARGLSLIDGHFVVYLREGDDDAKRGAPPSSVSVVEPGLSSIAVGNGRLSQRLRSCLRKSARELTLPGAEHEAVEVTKIWRAARRTVSLRRGAEATEENVLAGGARILHIATHAWADLTCDGVSPTALALAPVGRAVGDEGDGVLTPRELGAASSLACAELVVLSGCQTGQGSRATSSLAASLTSAGVRTVLVSLWSVTDDATGQFMGNFHRAVARGLSRSAAWRSAVRHARVLNPSPHAWASFILVGEPGVIAF